MKLSGPRLGTTHVAAFIGYPRNGKADPANAAPTVKALIDGMVDAGVWPDDDSTYVIGPTVPARDLMIPGAHIPRPRIAPDYEALHLDLVDRIEALIDQAGSQTYWGLQLAAALRGEDE
jgi:hypothetical protein